MKEEMEAAIANRTARDAERKVLGAEVRAISMSRKSMPSASAGDDARETFQKRPGSDNDTRLSCGSGKRARRDDAEVISDPFSRDLEMFSEMIKQSDLARAALEKENMELKKMRLEMEKSEREKERQFRREEREAAEKLELENFKLMLEVVSTEKR
jgi:hypothetical protein